MESDENADRLAELTVIANTRPLTLVERIERWRLEDGGHETEDMVHLLCEAEDALAQVQQATDEFIKRLQLENQ
jgi:hypothetical protein